MNERIKLLAEQAKLGSAEFGNGIQYYVATQETFEKFAQLIVMECAEMVRIQNEQFMENESHYGVVSTDVLKHFGVEE
jgi:hypothetical protein